MIPAGRGRQGAPRLLESRPETASEPMMLPEAGSPSAGEDAQARLARHLAEAGYGSVTPPVLQPVEPFLELSGEDIRRRIFVTQDEGGTELCLRPEFTIPVCRLHRSRADGQSADYSYLIHDFRLAGDEPDEVLQDWSNARCCTGDV